MTQEEIIRMARETGLVTETHGKDWIDAGFPDDCLFDFATLVAAHEREACAKESLEVLDNLRKETIAQCQKGMIEAYKLGQYEEREACAKVADNELMNTNMLTSYPPKSSAAWNIAAAIRARGNDG